MLRKLLLSAVVLAMFVALLSVMAVAIFTSSTSVAGNVFTTGTVIISTSPASTLITLGNMAPGDQITAPITVSDDGTLDLRYAVSSATTENVLASQLVLQIKSGVTACTDGGFGADGTTIYGPGVLGNTTPVDLIGDPAQGAQAGDRTLLAGANEVLCFNASLPLSTGNSFQGLTSTATFTFAGEQITNNP
jgi:spore coat-associated protein N